MVTPVACFATGPGQFSNKNKPHLMSHTINCSVALLAHLLVWISHESRPRHEILHDWNVRILVFVVQTRLKPCSKTCFEQHLLIMRYTYRVTRGYLGCCIGKLLGNLVLVAPADKWTTCGECLADINVWGNGKSLRGMLAIGKH